MSNLIGKKIRHKGDKYVSQCFEGVITGIERVGPPRYLVEITKGQIKLGTLSTFRVGHTAAFFPKEVNILED